MTNGIWSPKLERMIGFVLVTRDVQVGQKLTVHKHGKELMGTVCDLPFV